MVNKQKNYDPAYKIEICKQIATGQTSVAAMSRETVVSENTLHVWMKRYRENNETPFVGSGRVLPENEELVRLRKENKDLHDENFILKKAASYFAKNQN